MNHIKPASLDPSLATIWDEVVHQVRPATPLLAIEAICRQTAILRDCARRIVEEGTIIVDAKGNAQEHPALRIERESAKQIREWLVIYAHRE